ncbi:MAG TPA: 1-acyl-sn-glycerol-3-phosphate acyltransferase [Firmicutes bacterium]|jgi:1-acyl-sn-glycerol-3-phosphate acyltransferase|nr:1-acyl-sn-glycerol-3-phosphate acyltransferase [Bacillota bacterium]
MFQRVINDKLKIIKLPLPFLTLGQRWFLKSLLLCCGHLVRTEHFNPEAITNDPLIFAFNHNSSYETILVPSYLIALRRGRKISFLIDWMFGYLPVLAWIFRQTEPIYVYNKKSDLKFLNRFRVKPNSATVYEQCLHKLNNNQSIGIFPEGTRNRNPESLIKGRKGIGYIALHSQVPVLPIGIDFPSRLKKGRIPKFGPLILRTGSMMHFDQEIAIYQQVNRSLFIHPLLKRKITDYLCAKVTYAVMKELANLAHKQYPFPKPVPPVAMNGFFLDPTLTEKILI